MNTFKAPLVPEDPAQAIGEIRQALQRLERSLNEAQPEFTLQVLHAAPAKTWAGMCVYADGTDWDPGSGQGVYVRNATNAAWRYLG